jgi:hypothetical protein
LFLFVLFQPYVFLLSLQLIIHAPIFDGAIAVPSTALFFHPTRNFRADKTVCFQAIVKGRYLLAVIGFLLLVLMIRKIEGTGMEFSQSCEIARTLTVHWVTGSLSKFDAVTVR